MNEYYCEFLKALSDGSIERRTDTENGEEAILRNGSLIASTSDAVSVDLIETVKAEPHLILFGSGHVGKALYDLGVLQKMRMTILDDRPELLTKERFPLAERHIAPFEDLLKKDYDAVAPAWIVFTHGHSYDTDCLRYALKRPASYIGMIGSKAKSARALEQLRSEGFGDELLQSVHTPIGLPIGAETPEEIAVSIMAEIISVFRKEKHSITVDPALLKAMAEHDGISIRIIEKHGSAPRAEGSEMLVTESSTYGTIGGGEMEKLAINEAREMLRNGTRHMKKRYDLSAEGDVGMVCGGNATLLFRSTACSR